MTTLAATSRARPSGARPPEPLLPRDLRGVYARILKFRAHHRLSTYNVTTRCNLKCKGCFFYEGDHMSSRADDASLQQWRHFFEQERARGIAVCDLSGGEPALSPARLRLAAEFFDHGIVYTNGIKHIPEDIRFKIHVSVWGNEESDRKVRGASILKNSLENYRHDPRAVIVYTFNHLNIKHVDEVAKRTQDAGIQLSFNHFSGTTEYVRGLTAAAPGDPSAPSTIPRENGLRLTADDLQRIRRTCSRLLDEYPDTVVYSETMNELVNQPQSVSAVDPATGVATDCWSLHQSERADAYRNHQTDFSQGRCCLPNNDCSECRVYVVMYGRMIFGTQQAFSRAEGVLTEEEREARVLLRDHHNLRKWLDVADAWLTLSVVGYQRERVYLPAGGHGR